MKYAICNEIFETWPWERVCSFCREMGYHGVEVAPFTTGGQPTVTRSGGNLTAALNVRR